jgi:DNA-cytosine methyltransferase
MNVLSLFDGMSCGQIALNRAGIKYENYFASEIDKYAIKVTQHNYPNTIQLGSVIDVKGSDLPKIDLLFGGSPCQGFSFAGKQLNFEDPRSKLFFEFVRLVKECNPTYFLLENVKMKKEYQDIITEHLGVEPIEINSNLVSGQNRKRIYWTNIPNVTQPNDKCILLKDIVHEHKDGVILFIQNFKIGWLVVSDSAIWLVLEKKYGLNYYEIEQLLARLLYKYTNNGQLKVG